MKVIIAGSRTITDPKRVEAAIQQSGFTISEVVSGGARGVDRMGEDWAKAHRVPCKIFQAAWYVHGNYAGLLRNQRMAEYADALIAVWDGESRGTRDMIDRAKKSGLKVFIAALAKESPHD